MLLSIDNMLMVFNVVENKLEKCKDIDLFNKININHNNNNLNKKQKLWDKILMNISNIVNKLKFYLNLNLHKIMKINPKLDLKI